LTAAGYNVKAQDIKNVLRDRNERPAENVIPANSPGVRDLVLALIDIWPSFEWERLVLDPPPGYLDNSIEEKCDRAQTDVMRDAERPVTSWDQTIVSVPYMMESYPHMKLKPPPHQPLLKSPRCPFTRPGFTHGSSLSRSLTCSGPRYPTATGYYEVDGGGITYKDVLVEGIT
jgi:hypothetical protein